MADSEDAQSASAGAEDDLNEEEEEDEEEMNPEDYLYNQDEFLQKLREKPYLPPTENLGCGVAARRKSDSKADNKYPTADRLTVNTLTELDILKEKIPLPEGRTPPLSLPSWHYLPMEKKIPLVQAPKGLLYYTRGKLGKKLYRNTVSYSINDPKNLERVLGGQYQSLHDPHAKPYLDNPLIRALLRDQGLINEQNEVLCTHQEFNKFRDYLRTLYTDEVWKLFGSGDSLMKSEQEQVREIFRMEGSCDPKHAKREERLRNVKAFQRDAAEYKKKKAEQQGQLNESRLRDWQNEKDRKILEHIVKSIEDQKMTNQRLEALYQMQLQHRRDIMMKSTRKFLETEERRMNDKAMMDAAYNRFLLEWIESKYVFSYEKLLHNKQLQQDINDSLKARARKRQRRLEKYREQMPMMLEKKKAEYIRLWAIVRKYAMRWLEKVRARMNAPKDLKHESCWIGTKSVLDDTVKYLYQESGYEKLDDFILNIMKLKKQIQAQIELEEAEEAALAAAQEAEAASQDDASGEAADADT